MEAKDSLHELAIHLLGKEWYSNCYDVNSVNDDVVNTIKQRYPAVDESPVEKWRRMHKRCYFCSHCSITRSTPFSPDVYICEAKGKTVNIDIPRPFCTLFELKKENNNEAST